jgi:hypothetical protein
MITEVPDLARLTNRKAGRRIDLIFFGLDPLALVKVLQAQIDFRQSEARDRQVKTSIKFSQLEEILTEQPLVPMGNLRQPVIRCPKCLQLRRGKMLDLDYRQKSQPHSSVASVPLLKEFPTDAWKTN